VELGVERITALWFLVIGASHVAAPAAWAKLFIGWRELGEQGSLMNGLLHAPLAVLIIGFHQMYAWPGLAVTALGWLLLLKSSAYLLAPHLLGKAQKASDQGEPRRYRAAGVLLMLLGAGVGSMTL